MTLSLQRFLLRRKTGEKMNRDERIVITNIPAISAFYFALLQCGYDYYSFERSTEHISAIKTFQQTNTSVPFFSETKQDTCDVYPYWPRAAMLETATFYIRSDMTAFADVEMYRDFIMSAGNISNAERSDSFWEWVNFFPGELKKVLVSDGFKNYINWENRWIRLTGPGIWVQQQRTECIYRYPTVGIRQQGSQTVLIG